MNLDNMAALMDRYPQLYFDTTQTLLEEILKAVRTAEMILSFVTGSSAAEETTTTPLILG